MTPATRAAIAAASMAFSVPADRIMSRCRFRTTIRAKWAAIAIMVDAGHSLSHIGRELGLDHTTVMHGIRAARTLPHEWYAKMSAAKAAAALPQVEPPNADRPVTPTKFQKYGDSRPTDSESRAVALRCAETIRQYWRRRGVEVAVEIEPVSLDKQKNVVYRIKSSGIPITPGAST